MTKGLMGLLLGVALAVAVGFTPAADVGSAILPGTTPSILPDYWGNNNYQPTGIWVTGEGSVSVVPDIAVLNLPLGL